MSFKQDLSGKLFGDSLRVIREVDIRNEHVYWLCRCEICGDEKTVSGSALTSGAASQCNWCYQETRWTIKSKERKEMCVDYLSGMSNNDILDKFGICRTNRSVIYRVLKKEGIKPDRRNISLNER